MLEAFVEHRRKVAEAKEAGKPLPKLPDYLGLCFMQIAERLGTKSNFSRYTYLDEMKADGIENCIIGAHNFDPEKGDNPFAYFTKIIWFAFLRRIEKEHKHSYIKYKAMQNMNITGSHMEGDLSGVSIAIDNVVMDNIVSAYEDKKARKDAKNKETKTRAKKGVETFFETEEVTEDIAESVLDPETEAQLGFARTSEGGADTGVKKSSGRKHRGG